MGVCSKKKLQALGDARMADDASQPHKYDQMFLRLCAEQVLLRFIALA